MSIEAGQNLLHYRIVEKIGEGGMGVVWKAVDTTLDREVAIKILPAAFAEDPGRLARFEREAKLLASLNHTHIAVIYGFHEDSTSTGSVRFLAMEFIPGEDLGERIARGAMPVEEVVVLARQIAEALEAAHEQGVVHRDLKPANIKLTPAGDIKVLDFGLAKALENESVSSGSLPSMSPTITAGTMAGTLLGTAAYMSPEQARGRPVDKRADIWAFGCVLYEMLTALRVFDGETVSDALAAALRATPDFDALPAATPVALNRLIGRCLEKDSKNRLRDIGEARYALSNLEMDAPPEPADTTLRKGRAGWAAMAAIAVVGALLGAALGWSLRTTPAALPRMRKLSLAAPVGIEESRLKSSISPDGRAMAYLAGGKLWIQEFDSLIPRPVVGGDGASELAWSPDSRLLAFAVRSKIWHTQPNGEPSLIANLPDAIGAGGGLAWDEDDGIVYSTGDDNLYTVPPSGGQPVVLLAPDLTQEVDFHAPAALPGGGILFVVHGREGSINTVDVFRDGKRHPLYAGDGIHIDAAVYSHTGHLIFTEIEASPGLWAVPMSLSRLEVTGEPFRITEKGSQPSASRDGSLLYSNVPGTGQHQLVFVGRDGKPQEKIGSVVNHADNVTLSPDGTKFAVCLIEPQGASLWVYDLQRVGARSRISSTGNCGGNQGASAWTSNGDGLALVDVKTGRIRLLGVAGVSDEELLVEGKQPTFTPDGRHMIFARADEDGREDLWSVEWGGEDDVTPQPWVTGPGRQMSPRVSPRDPLVAYVADDSGRHEVYVRAFPDSGSAWQVSIAGGTYPRWASDGKHLYFLQDEVVVMEVDVVVGPGPTVQLSDPREVFAGEAYHLAPNHGWDVLGTGERFITVEALDVDVSGRDLTLITDWMP